jgi:3-phosphoshikimate 1-carboxyvinyltransferase
MLSAFGATVSAQELTVSVEGGAQLAGRPVAVPGDFSSAAYFIAAASLCSGSDVTVRDVLLNATRTGLLRALEQMGADVTVANARVQAGERVGDIRTRCSDLCGARVAMIDEVPLLAVIATQAEGKTVIGGASELRVKESDRIALTVEGLRAMGAHVEERPDGMVVVGPTRLRQATIDARHDHRIAMSFAVAGLIADGETVITGAECIGTSFPGFVSRMQELGADVQEERS